MAGAAPLTLRRKAIGLGRQVLARPASSTVVFNSFRGKYSDNPRAIFEQLLRTTAGADVAWVTAEESSFPEGVRLLPAASDAYFTGLGQARWIVSNAMVPALLPKPNVTYLQTWHGTPLKRVGFDNPRFAAKNLRKAARDYRQWDYLLSQNPHSTEVLRRAFRYDGPVLEVG